mgnify:CR=1 FL=1
MFKLNRLIKKPGHDHISGAGTDDDPNLSLTKKQLMVKVEQLSKNLSRFESRLQTEEQQAAACFRMLFKYEKIICELISLYRLQISKIEIIENSYHCHESFIKDVEKHIDSFIKNEKFDLDNFDDISPLKRILLRFLHQNTFNEMLTRKKITELEQLISEKQQLIFSFQNDLKHLKNNGSITAKTKKSTASFLN